MTNIIDRINAEIGNFHKKIGLQPDMILMDDVVFRELLAFVTESGDAVDEFLIGKEKCEFNGIQIIIAKQLRANDAGFLRVCLSLKELKK